MTWQLPIIAIPPRPGAAPACSDAGLLAIAQGLRQRVGLEEGGRAARMIE